MASPEYVKSFMSAGILVGDRRYDPNGVRFIKMGVVARVKNQLPRPCGRYLSEEPSTYLR